MVTYHVIQKQPHLLQFLKFHSAETGQHLQPPDSWTLNAPKVCLQPSPSCKRILVYLEPRERVRWLLMSFFLARGANSAVLPQIV